MTAKPFPCVVVKLGGAFFTDKLVAGKVHYEKMANFCKNLAELMLTELKPRGLSLILVAGGGSIGHHSAKSYKVDLGVPECDLVSVFQMSEAMLVMKADMCRHLASHNLAAFPMQEAALLYVTEHNKIQVHAQPLLHSLGLKQLPVLSGGFVFDRTRGVRPLNGDKLVSALANLPGLAVKRVLFLSGENGLLDELGDTVPCLTPQDRSNALKFVRTFDDAGVDVTGGMKTKIECCFDIAELGVEARIVAGSLSKNDLCDALLGRSNQGTFFYPEVRVDSRF